jgi:putative ABC transport system permease protein
MVLSLALGIGACITIFSLLNAWVLRPFPFPESERLVVIREVSSENPEQLLPASLPNLEDWRRQSGEVFEQLAGLTSGTFTLVDDIGAAWATGVYASPGLFRLLGVAPILGRDFTENEGLPGNDDVVILGYPLWQERFGGDPEVLGRTLQLDGRSHTVVGVLPEGFEFIFPTAELWVPIAPDPAALGRETRVFLAVGRLQPGVALEQAQERMDGVARRLAEQVPENAGFGVRLLTPQGLFLGPNNRLLLQLLAGTVTLVLLIACFNVANLLVARSLRRSGEIGLRAALGARPRRLLRQLLTESLVISLLGGVGGLLVAAWGMRILVTSLPARVPRLQEVGFDPRVLAFAVAVSLVATVLSGLAPALRSLRVDLTSVISPGGRGGSQPGRRLRAALVVAEIALALVLLAAAGLMARSAIGLQDVEAGFDASGLLTAAVSLPASEYDDADRILGFYRSALERLDTLPGVSSAAAVSALPRGRGTPDGQVVAVDGRPLAEGGEGSGPSVHWLSISGGYFETLGIPLRRGRGFGAGDRADGPPVVVVGENLAQRFWPGEDPIGRRLTFLGAEREVVGVAGAVLQDRIPSGDASVPTLYLPVLQLPMRSLTLVLRTGADPEAVAPRVREELRELAPDQPVPPLITMEQHVADQFKGLRLIVRLLGIFSALALLLAMIGVYGIVSGGVTARRRELGIRIALGAERPELLRLVLSDAARLTAVGVVLGLAGAYLTARAMAGLLFGTGPLDPLALVPVLAILTLTSFLAVLPPLRRALAADPVAALRYE